MGKYSMRFDKFVRIQKKDGTVKVGIENRDNWADVGKVRRCSFKFNSGDDYKTEFADKVLVTATVRIKYDPTINETMRVVLLGSDSGEFKIISALPVNVNGRKVTQMKVQRWAAL